jgi:hypothetical protein
MTITKHRDIRAKIKQIAIGSVALLTMTAAAAAAPAGDEAFREKNAVPVNGQPLTSFDMSFVDPTLGLYFLADRSNAAIDVLPTGTLTPTATTLGAGVFVGIASGGNTSGPNGVITASKHTEVWAGDGPSIDSITGLSTSHVVVIDVASNVATHKIDTGGVMRAGKLCEDPKDKLVLVANDGPQDLFLSFISTNKYEAIGKIKLDGSDPNGSFIKATNATNGIAQCQWNQFTGSFYVAVPEVGGPGDNSAAGAVLVIDPKNMNVEKVFAVEHALCVGPQGLAIGPNPQILLGCTGVGPAPYANVPPGSVVISAIDGSTLFQFGLNGIDEVWYNPGDNSYFLAANNNTVNFGFGPQLDPFIGVVDAGGGISPDGSGLEEDGPFFVNTVAFLPDDHSIAVDPSATIVYVPTPQDKLGNGVAACGGVNSSCIVLMGAFGPDDPGVVVAKH